MRKITKNELLKMKKPVRYIGMEYNECIKNKVNKVRVCNAYSNLYEIGIKNKKFNSIYFNLNINKECYTERVFLPDEDMIHLMNINNIGLQSLETGDFLEDFDIIIFNINDVLEYVNVLQMLRLSNIEIRSKSRLKEKSPIIIALGNAIENNFAPISDFIDCFVIGEPEEVLELVVNKYKDYQSQNLTKIDFLRMLKNIQGIHIPLIHTNTLVYSATNNVKSNKVSFVTPNMWECFNENKINCKNVEVITSSDRLRKIFGLKDINNEEYLVNFFTNVIRENIELIKIKFIIGLPGENYQDLTSICKFVKKIIGVYNEILSVSNCTFSLSFEFENFIIYPHTKFEWLRKNKAKELINKKEFIEKNLNNNNNNSENIKITFENSYITQFKEFLLFSDSKVSEKLENLLGEGFVFYNCSKIVNLDSVINLKLQKYSDCFDQKGVEERFPFDMVIIPGCEKTKLKKDFKKISKEICEV